MYLNVLAVQSFDIEVYLMKFITNT